MSCLGAAGLGTVIFALDDARHQRAPALGRPPLDVSLRLIADFKQFMVALEE
jgi:hypothetical protein